MHSNRFRNVLPSGWILNPHTDAWTEFVDPTSVEPRVLVLDHLPTPPTPLCGRDGVSG